MSRFTNSSEMYYHSYRARINIMFNASQYLSFLKRTREREREQASERGNLKHWPVCYDTIVDMRV